MNYNKTDRHRRSAADQIIGYLEQAGEDDAAELVEDYRDKWVGEE